MYDLNFLGAPVSHKKRSILVPVLLIVAILALVGVGAYYGLMQFNLDTIQQDINQLNAYIESDQVMNDMAELDIVKSKDQLLTVYQNEIEAIDLYLKTVNILDGQALDAIVSAAPVGVRYTSMTISGFDLTIEAGTPDNATTAQLIHNLSLLPEIKQAELLTVTYQEGDMPGRAAIHCILKDVMSR